MRVRPSPGPPVNLVLDLCCLNEYNEFIKTKGHIMLTAIIAFIAGGFVGYKGYQKSR